MTGTRRRWTAVRVLGLLLMAAGLAAFVWGLFNLMEIGTCASGGPYVSARPCPDGSGAYFAAVPLGIVAAVVGGLVSGAAMLIMPVTFVAVGAASLLAGLVGDADGAFPIVFGALFLFFGLLPLVIGGALRRGRAAGTAPGTSTPTRTPTPLRPAAPPPTAPPPPPPPPPDEKPDALRKLDSLERLAKLRREGAISDAEYERLKTEVLAEG